MLELVNITKDYPLVGNVVHALKGVSIKFRSSEFVSILGPSGCGKTTMLNIIGGLDRYTSGDLKIDGISTKDYTARDWDTYRNHKIGFVFQSYNLIQHLSVLQNVELALTISGVSPKEKREKAVKALERVGLKDEINKKPAQLSGGQMQRVAIARAIVNDPQIILADEPTGALDSATSVQVMDILKEISNDRLVIMVTHNADLANKYSSRIIKLLDGVKVSDSNPPGDDEIDEALKDAIVKKDDEMSLSKEKKNKRKKRSSMSLFTALSLSARNLVTKKFRTSLTTFAGSIGIIGIALVLSISNGFSKYMSKLERTTLASFPITVSSYALEVDTTATNYLPDMEGAFPDTGQIIPYEPENSFGGVNIHANMLTQDFVDYVKRMEAEHPDWAASVAYSQKVKMHVLTKTESNTYAKIDTANDSNLWWQELLDNDFVGSYYDILAGRLPQSKDELVLIVNSKNQITAQSLKALGFNPAISQGDGDYAPIDFSAIIGDASGNGAKELKLLTNDEYYKQTEEGLFKELTTAEFEAAYNGAETTLKFVGIIRIKQTSDLVFFNSGVGYSPKLTHYVLEQAEKSKIAKAQAETYIDLLGDGGKLFEIDFTTIDMLIKTMGVSEYMPQIKMLYVASGAITPQQATELGDNYTMSALYDKILLSANGDRDAAIDKMIAPLSDYLKDYGLDKDTIINYINSDYVERLQEIGANTIPSKISIYPASFEAKALIKAYLDAYNEGVENTARQIKYTDLAATVAQSVSQMVDTVSYVLIAFAAISLVVSSVMIAIITYISVLERTKEIGVLRSLGARKIDVANVFNAETLIIGAASGVFGVVVAAILTLPINAIIAKFVNGMVTNIAKLHPLHGILLVVLSMALTVLSGLIPAFMASKRDPVVALRSN